MGGQLIPPPELAAPSLKHLTPTQRVEAWIDWMDACEQFVLAGLRLKVGPEGDLQEAHRRWHQQCMEEHDRTMIRMMERFARRGEGHAG